MTEPPRPPGNGPSGPDPEPPPPPPSYPAPDAGAGAGYPPPPPGAAPPPPGAAPPPPGGYGQGPAYGGAPGYGAPGYGGAPGGYPSQDDKTWALLAHFGGAGGMFLSGGWLGWVVPLIAFIAKGNQSPVARAHAAAALNFQLLWSIIAAAGFLLGICGSLIVVGVVFFLVPLVAWIIGTIFGIIAGVRANEGQLYRYPMTVNWIK